MYKCEACNKMLKNARPTYTFSFKVGDAGESIIVGILGEQGDGVLQMTA